MYVSYVDLLDYKCRKISLVNGIHQCTHEVTS